MAHPRTNVCDMAEHKLSFLSAKIYRENFSGIRARHFTSPVPF